MNGNSVATEIEKQTGLKRSTKTKKYAQETGGGNIAYGMRFAGYNYKGDFHVSKAYSDVFEIHTDSPESKSRINDILQVLKNLGLEIVYQQAATIAFKIPIDENKWSGHEGMYRKGKWSLYKNWRHDGEYTLYNSEDENFHQTIQAYNPSQARYSADYFIEQFEKGEIMNSRNIKSAKNFAEKTPYDITLDDGKKINKGTVFNVEYDRNEQGEYVLGISINGLGKTQLRFDSEKDAFERGWIIESSHKQIKSSVDLETVANEMVQKLKNRGINATVEEDRFEGVNCYRISCPEGNSLTKQSANEVFFDFVDEYESQGIAFEKDDNGSFYGEDLILMNGEDWWIDSSVKKSIKSSSMKLTKDDLILGLTKLHDDIQKFRNECRLSGFQKEYVKLFDAQTIVANLWDDLYKEQNSVNSSVIKSGNIPAKGSDSEKLFAKISKKVPSAKIKGNNEEGHYIEIPNDGKISENYINHLSEDFLYDGYKVIDDKIRIYFDEGDFGTYSIKSGNMYDYKDCSWCGNKARGTLKDYLEKDGYDVETVCKILDANPDEVVCEDCYDKRMYSKHDDLMDMEMENSFSHPVQNGFDRNKESLNIIFNSRKI